MTSHLQSWFVTGTQNNPQNKKFYNYCSSSWAKVLKTQTITLPNKIFHFLWDFRRTPPPPLSKMPTIFFVYTHLYVNNNKSVNSS